MRDELVDEFAREETGPEAPESKSGRSVLWRLEANNRVKELDLLVARITSGIEARLDLHVARAAATAAASPPSQYQLPNAHFRIVEMLIHALYTGQLQAMNASGVFYDPPAYDLVQVFCLAEELDIECVQQCVIVDFFKKKEFSAIGATETMKVIVLLKEKKLKKCKLEALFRAWLRVGGAELQEYLGIFQTE
ncbi:uncharacterized protein BDZ99DRAFT_475100 [Mytilinidion resinicola]|uniref:BTB domain-containing protein n=1 Tax=Mytilinidion resinicola TaxID=574789 RepID=A0A6A6YSR4_9PEZI|nr:uncharacterized protein BDZ99DRAFT_475100 [Mytilinidion resinicola]KAF2811559.1 hypothetical protein BDZ99DRAFT_475100 [Mytilinidion resinicola]